MSGTSRILDIARRALSAQEAALSVTSHNIANVNTAGYSRQRAVMEAATPSSEPWGMVGTGVDVQTIEQIRDRYVDTEIRSEMQTLGRWQYKEQVFSEIESIYNEPSDTGLASVMNDFFDSWSELANDPQSSSTRERVRQTGEQLVNKFHNLNERLTDLQGNLNTELSQSVSEFNSMLQQVADLNERIVLSEAQGVVANDYRDRRNYVLEQLSAMANVGISESQTGSVTLTIDGNILVERDTAYELGLHDRSIGYAYVSDVVMGSSGQPVNLTDGKLKGLLEMRDEIIPEHLQSLDDLANALVTEVNTLHSAGYDQNGFNGRNFFDANSSGARDIALDPSIVSDVENIAASEDGSAGNGGTALAIASIEEEDILDNGTVSAEEYFAAVIGTLGVQSQEATFMRENQELMVGQLQNQQDAVSGVSLDEEMTNLIKYQHAYQAAAQLVTTVDEMMQTLIDMV